MCLKKKALQILLLLTTIFSLSSFSLNGDDTIEKTNNTILTFFLNLELTKRNAEIPGIQDYMPGIKKNTIQEIEVNTRKTDHFSENILFSFKENYLSDIKYTVKRSDIESSVTFRYNLSYIQGKLNKVTVKNRLLYKFNYTSKGILKQVKLFSKDQKIVEIYNIKYDNKASKVKLSLDVIRNKDVYFDVNESRDFLILNKAHKLKKFLFDSFSYDHISYSKLGYIETIIYSNLISKNNDFTWNYTKLDSINNWIQRKSEKEKYTAERIIKYK